jgi:ABC-2 type transport system permease protein
VTLAGILPLLAIDVLAFIATLLVEAVYGVLYLPALLQWLALSVMLNIFFYGFASLCAQLTGNLVVLPLVYAVLNFTVYVVEWLVDRILSIFVFGFYGSGLTFECLSPVMGIYDHCRINSISVYDAADKVYTVTGYYLTGWGLIICYAAVGLVLIAGALLHYKRRRMETAGDVVAVRYLKPVFKYCMALGVALCLGMLLFTLVYSNYNNEGTPAHVLLLIAFMLIGCFIGYFAAEMLMQKCFSVWRGRRRWLGYGIACLVIISLTFACEFDLFGFEKRVPAAEDVKDVLIQTSGDETDLAAPENIEDFVALHSSIIAGKAYHESENEYTCGVYLVYTMKDGSTLKRSYALSYNNEAEDGDVRTLQNLINRQEAIDYRKQLDFPVTAENIDYACVDYRVPSPGENEYGDYQEIRLTAEEANELYYECILPDIDDGTLGRMWLISDEDYMNTVYACSINFECLERDSNGEYTYQNFYTVPTVDSQRTNAWLDARGVEFHTEGEFQSKDDINVTKAVAIN